MSFNTLTKAELIAAAESFGVEVGKTAKKDEVIKSLEDEGVTFDIYSSMVNAERVDVDDDALEVFTSKPVNPEPLDNAILVKMDRANTFYQVGKYTFTIEHPFVAMPEDDAQEIFDNEEGFRVATPSEVKNYYS